MEEKQKEILVVAACQIVYAYPDWDEDYASDVYDMLKVSGTNVTPDIETFFEMISDAQAEKDSGKTNAEAEKALLEKSEITMSEAPYYLELRAPDKTLIYQQAINVTIKNGKVKELKYLLDGQSWKGFIDGFLEK